MVRQRGLGFRWLCGGKEVMKVWVAVLMPLNVMVHGGMSDGSWSIVHAWCES